MKKPVLLLLAGMVMLVLAGCATQQAGSDAGRERTAYTFPGPGAPTETGESVWQMNPAISP